MSIRDIFKGSWHAEGDMDNYGSYKIREIYERHDNAPEDDEGNVQIDIPGEDHVVAEVISCIPQLVKAMHDNEWVWGLEDAEPCCLFCGSRKTFGHARNCVAKRIIALTREVNNA